VTASLVLWFVLSILCDVSGQICFKFGADRLPAEASLLGKAHAILTSPPLIAGICIYAVEVIVWLKILSEAPLTVAFPIASLNFLGVTLASAAILREKVGRRQWLGAVVVTIGVAIVAGTA
jgi:drug/metabolite transporter (DMT)-like permease